MLETKFFQSLMLLGSIFCLMTCEGIPPEISEVTTSSTSGEMVDSGMDSEESPLNLEAKLTASHIKGCVPGSKKCNGDQAMTCNSSGKWGVGLSCPYGCTNGRCQAK